MACDTPQGWLSYLIWPRRCPACGQRRNIRIWVVEGFYILASVLLVLYPPYKIGTILGMVVLAYFGTVVLIDLEYRLIMHPVSLGGAGLGLIIGVVRVGWAEALIGGVVGYGIMVVLYMLGYVIIKLVGRIRGQAVNDVALGYGDVNLSGVLGLMLGYRLIIYALLTAVVVGGVVSLVYLIIKVATRKYQAFMALPYGPFLVFGAVIFIYFRDQVLALLGG